MLSYPYALLPVVIVVGALVLLTNAYLALIALMVLAVAVLAALAAALSRASAAARVSAAPGGAAHQRRGNLLVGRPAAVCQ